MTLCFISTQLPQLKSLRRSTLRTAIATIASTVSPILDVREDHPFSIHHPLRGALQTAPRSFRAPNQALEQLRLAMILKSVHGKGLRPSSTHSKLSSFLLFAFSPPPPRVLEQQHSRRLCTCGQALRSPGALQGPSTLGLVHHALARHVCVVTRLASVYGGRGAS